MKGLSLFLAYSIILCVNYKLLASLSCRVREYGLRPVEGDLVLKKVDDPSRLLTLRYMYYSKDSYMQRVCGGLVLLYSTKLRLTLAIKLMLSLNYHTYTTDN